MTSLRAHPVRMVVLFLVVLWAASGHGMAQSLLQVVQAGDRDAVSAAIRSGADLDERDAYGQTPLMYAVTFNRMEIVEMLLTEGADVSARTLAGWTALHYAARDGNGSQIVAILLNAGANPSVRNQDGDTPQAIAASAGNQSAVDALRRASPPPAATTPAPSAPPPGALPSRPPAATTATMRREAFARIVGERPGDMLWQDDSPMRTGDAAGWYTAVFNAPGNPFLNDVRVYVANLDTGQSCGWNVDLAAAGGARQTGIRVFASGRLSEVAYPSFNFHRGNALIALVANYDSGRCERHVY